MKWWNELKDFLGDIRGKIIIIGAVIVFVFFINLLIILVTKGRLGLY